MTDLLILVNIFVLEVILSIDNAAVLATMVKPLAAEKRKLAIGAMRISRDNTSQAMVDTPANNIIKINNCCSTELSDIGHYLY